MADSVADEDEQAARFAEADRIVIAEQRRAAARVRAALGPSPAERIRAWEQGRAQPIAPSADPAALEP